MSVTFIITSLVRLNSVTNHEKLLNSNVFIATKSNLIYSMENPTTMIHLP